MRFYSPVDLAGNVNMIGKLVLGGTGTGDLPILSPTRKPLRHQDMYIAYAEYNLNHDVWCDCMMSM